MRRSKQTVLKSAMTTDLSRRRSEPDGRLENAEPAIAVSGLTKRFPIPFQRREILAVDGLDLTVAPGECYGLLGPNGSGKSTTLKIILGLVSPTHGETRIFGLNSALVRSRQSVGFLPENPYFYKFLTADETLRFFGKLCGLRGETLDSRIVELLELVGLTNARNQRLGTYSKGMLQRIGLAQALINQPKVVILDEPTAGVDPAGSRDIRNVIVDLKKQGTTVLLSSHLLAQVEEICDRVGILGNGKLIREGRLEELLAVENQTELVLDNATDDLLRKIDNLAAESKAKIVRRQKAATTLEDLFLDVTQKASKAREPGE